MATGGNVPTAVEHPQQAEIKSMPANMTQPTPPPAGNEQPQQPAPQQPQQ
jgi:hypothetical protein